MERATSIYPLVHLFDEPQFNTQDGYIGFMLDFFRKLRNENRLVFICLHPTADYQIRILKEICERFLFVSNGEVGNYRSFAELASQQDVRQYLGALAH
jgi:ABC-type histidine transport system ATPase subunit